MPIRIDDKGRVVVGVILRAHAGAAIVVTSRAECRAVKLTDGRTIRSAETQMHPRSGDTPMNSIGKIACATIVAASLFLMSACTIAPYQSLESEAFLTSENNISQLAANDSFNQ